MSSSAIEVIIQDLANNPRCPHGPTLLFSRGVKSKKETFFACSATRDRKLCPFYLLESERKKYKSDVWNEREKKFLKGINHRKKFLIMNKILRKTPVQRMYCLQCMKFLLKIDSHEEHKLIKDISDASLKSPSTFLPPLDNSKVEAQYLFLESSVAVIVNIFKSLNYLNVICIGAPRIHEFIKNTCPNMSSILLDIDRRFHDFFGPLEFCWYNLFNNHFFFNEGKQIFEDFLTLNGGNDIVLITDPPFGGRTEPIIYTLESINNLYKKLNKTKKNLPVFWIFPYFMEPYILNGLPDFKMLDYKVEYENHPLFQNDPNGPKQGSPVRMFTNVNTSLIKFPDDNYKYCKKCKLWVSLENKHCDICKSCTSKDGRTYVHCKKCNKCVKPTWSHCDNCNKCALPGHECSIILFTKECFHCKETGHKKSDCPQLKSEGKKRLKGVPTMKKKKIRKS